MQMWSAFSYPFAIFLFTISIAIGTLPLRFAFSLSKSRADEMSLELVRDEQLKLRTMLSAAEAALKFSRNAGYYERRRQSIDQKDKHH